MTDHNADALFSVDVATNTIIGRTPVGHEPRAVVADAHRFAVWVADEGDSTVDLVDPRGLDLTRIIPLGSGSGAVSEAEKPDGTQLWVGCDNGDISVIDAASAAVVNTLYTGAPVISVSFDTNNNGDYAFVLSRANGPRSSLTIIATATGAQYNSRSLTDFPSGAVASGPYGVPLFIGDEPKGSVFITGMGHPGSSTNPGGTTQSLDYDNVGSGVLSPDGGTVYFCSPRMLAAFSVDYARLHSDLQTPCGNPGGFAITPDGTTLYAPSGLSVNVVDTTTGKIDATIPGFLGPDSIAIGRVYFPPRADQIGPHQGPETGGAAVTISGKWLTGATAVTFGTTPASSFTVDSDTQITAVAPPGPEGQVVVTVTNPNGTSTNYAAGDFFTYVEAPPTITGVSPNSGSSRGGTTVTITGTDLSTTKSVFFGGTEAASFTVDSDTQITATAPAGTAGTVEVSVTTDVDTSQPVAADQYAYVAS